MKIFRYTTLVILIAGLATLLSFTNTTDIIKSEGSTPVVGINIGNDKYLGKLVNDFGLSWGIINKELSNNNWQKILKKNLDDL